MTNRPVLLDLFCKAGGTSMGYHQAGFDVVGVDIEPQPNYPFEFIQADCLELSPSEIRREFDAVAASPPCQAYSSTRSLHPGAKHPDLVEATRDLLRDTGLHWVIENVPGAPLLDPVVLCGSSFGLRVRRHRLFETNWSLEGLPCEHSWQERHKPYIVRHSHRRWYYSGVVRVFGGRQHLDPEVEPFGDNGRGTADPNEHLKGSVSMGIDWMTKKELTQAIPPAYTRWIGKQLLPLVEA